MPVIRCYLLATLLCAAGVQAQVRVFMAPDGEQFNAPTSGPTTVTLQPCETIQVVLWIEDATPGQVFRGIQVLFPWLAQPGAGATGSVRYVHDGGSYWPNPTIDETIDLTMDGQTCSQPLDCCSEYARCVWCDCVDGSCVVRSRRNGDAAGAYEDCLPDGHVNLHDRLHAMRCFWGVSECWSHNIDINNPHGACTPDGFCNIHDANAVDRMFSNGGVDNFCMCPDDPTPDNPSSSGSGSMVIDEDRPDYFINNGLTPTLFERVSPPAASAAFGIFAMDGVPSTISGMRYMAHFELTASIDAQGVFTLAPFPEGHEIEGGTFAVGDSAAGAFGLTPFTIDAYQPLHIVVTPATAIEAWCCDAEPDGVRDEICQWCGGCPDRGCDVFSKVLPSDVGGTFGLCVPDGYCNVHDASMVRAAFAGTAPCPAINLDAGGAFGACALDGFVNVHDVNHAFTCFANSNTCSCGPAPQSPAGPATSGSTTLTVVAPAHSVHPGEIVEAHVFLAGPQPRLQSYQLHVGVSGGRAGDLELIEFAIEPRPDHVFAQAGYLDARNLNRGQLFAAQPMRTKASMGTYLATLRYRVSKDAVGQFLIDLHADEAAGDQTMLVADHIERITVSAIRGAVIDVLPSRRRR